MVDMQKYCDQLENVIIRLDEQSRALETILLDFKRSLQGVSCVLCGRRESGKSLLLNSLLKKHFSADKRFEIIEEDGDCCVGFSQPMKKLSELGFVDDYIDKDKVANLRLTPRIIVIDHFEYFTSKNAQSFLYTLLNGTHQFPWCVVMIGVTQSCTSVPPLEKRVFSRLSTSIIYFDAKYTVGEIFEIFESLLDSLRPIGSEFEFNAIRPSTSNQKQELCLLLTRFTEHRPRVMAALKKLLMLYLITYNIGRGDNREMLADEYGGEECNEDGVERDNWSAVEKLRYCVGLICPEDVMLSTLETLPLRQLCLLYCFVLLQRSEGKPEFLCRNVILEFKRFQHTYEVSSIFPEMDDFLLYKDLEELIELAVVTLKGGADIGELQFKKASLNIEEEVLMKRLLGYPSLPLEVSKWTNLN